MEGLHKNMDYFMINDLNGTFFSITIPLGTKTPKELVIGMYNEICLELQKLCVDIGKVTVKRNIDNELQISIFIIKPFTVFQLMKIIYQCHRYYCEIEIPMCLYMLRKEITEKLKTIVENTNTSMFFKISNSVVLFIGGKENDCLEARIQIIKMIEELFNNESTTLQMHVPINDAVSRGSRIYSKSRINTSEILVTSNCQIENYSESLLIVETFYLDTMKLFYLLVNKKIDIENILSETQCYMITGDFSLKYSEIKIKGFNTHEIKKAKDAINNAYNKIIKILISSMDNYCPNNIILFGLKDKKKCLAIGDKKHLLDFISNTTGYLEAEMDIEYETAEFLCGKKNGKISKIMKDVQCTISVNKRPESHRAHIIIQGLTNSFECALLLVENEFPEELTFFIDERHHKRIIGYGGKNIQKIMKKHGVYIKFMNEHERLKSGYNDNVIIKTPRKNSNNLEKMKYDVICLIGEKLEVEEQIETEISLIDFYDFYFSKYKICYNTAKVSNIDKCQYSYYLFDEKNVDIYLKNLVKPNIYIKKTNQKFIKTSKSLPFEKITSMHWIQGISDMNRFSWLVRNNYTSLYSAASNNKNLPTDNISDVYINSFYI